MLPVFLLLAASAEGEPEFVIPGVKKNGAIVESISKTFAPFGHFLEKYGLETTDLVMHINMERVLYSLLGKCVPIAFLTTFVFAILLITECFCLSHCCCCCENTLKKKVRCTWISIHSILSAVLIIGVIFKILFGFNFTKSILFFGNEYSIIKDGYDLIIENVYSALNNVTEILDTQVDELLEGLASIKNLTFSDLTTEKPVLENTKPQIENIKSIAHSFDADYNTIADSCGFDKIDLEKTVGAMIEKIDNVSLLIDDAESWRGAYQSYVDDSERKEYLINNVRDQFFPEGNYNNSYYFNDISRDFNNNGVSNKELYQIVDYSYKSFKLFLIGTIWSTIAAVLLYAILSACLYPFTNSFTKCFYKCYPVGNLFYQFAAIIFGVVSGAVVFYLTPMCTDDYILNQVSQPYTSMCACPVKKPVYKSILHGYYFDYYIYAIYYEISKRISALPQGDYMRGDYFNDSLSKLNMLGFNPKELEQSLTDLEGKLTGGQCNSDYFAKIDTLKSYITQISMDYDSNLAQTYKQFVTEAGSFDTFKEQFQLFYKFEDSTENEGIKYFENHTLDCTVTREPYVKIRNAVCTTMLDGFGYEFISVMMVSPVLFFMTFTICYKKNNVRESQVAPETVLDAQSDNDDDDDDDLSYDYDYDDDIYVPQPQLSRHPTAQYPNNTIYQPQMRNGNPNVRPNYGITAEVL